MVIKILSTLGLHQESKFVPGIATGKFGVCGRMVINSFFVPDELKNQCKEIIMDNIKKTTSGCWKWTGRNHNGYPCMAYPGGSTKWAHRVSYAVYVGPIAEQRHIDHRCRNRLCVNPAHLIMRTPIENYEAVHRRNRQDIKKAQRKAGQLTVWDAKIRTLIPYFQMMLGELQGQRLEVIKAPNLPEFEDREQSGCQIKVKVSENPEWYKKLCAKYPSNRTKPRKRKEGYVDTRIKRAWVLTLLTVLAEGKSSKSQLAHELVAIAEDLYTRYPAEDVAFYNEHGFYPESFVGQF